MSWGREKHRRGSPLTTRNNKDELSIRSQDLEFIKKIKKQFH